MSAIVIEESKTYTALPPNLYQGEFVELEETTTSNGDAYRWKFKILDGEHAGAIFSELTDRKATTKNKLGRFLCALANRPLEKGSVDPKEYIGRKYTLVVDAKEGGGSKLTTFKKVV